MKHDLKIWPRYFEAVASGKKNFELRETSDRSFSDGDTLCLREFDPETKTYTGRTIECEVTYVLGGVQWNGRLAAVLGLSTAATERQAKEKAEAELYAERQKARELVEALTPFSHPDLGKQTTAAMADAAIVFGRDKALLRRSDFNKAASILARHKGA